MKALVTGGAGFIGSNLVHRLAADGHDVTVLDNFSSGYRSNLPDDPRVTVVEGDVRSADAVATAAQGAEVIFHLAASVGNARSLADPVQDAEINVIGTIRILEAARHGGIRKVVISSSAGIFGELVTLPIREDHPVEPDTPYGASKLCEEKQGLAYGRLYGFDVVCLRYFNVYGPRQRFDAYGNVIPIFVFQALDGRPITIFGDGEQSRDFVNVADVVQANLKAAAAPGVSGAFNIGSATRITINGLVWRLQRAGLSVTAHHGPPRLGDVRDSLADVSAARAAFGYHPSVDIDTGLAEYVAWARLRQGSGGQAR